MGPVIRNGEGPINNSLAVQPKGAVKANVGLCLVECRKAIQNWNHKPCSLARQTMPDTCSWITKVLSRD